MFSEHLISSSYHELMKRYGVVFKRLGLSAGDCVHILLENSNESVPAALGTWINGGVVSLGDHFLDAKAVAQQVGWPSPPSMWDSGTRHSDVFYEDTWLQIEDLQAKLVLFLPSMATLAKDLSSPLGESGVQFLCLGQSEGFPNLEKLSSDVSSRDFVQPYVSPDVKTEVAVIFWSSGTSGTG